VSRERISALVAALAIVGMGRIAWLHFVSEPLHEARNERIDLRYAPLRPFLQPGRIGYVSDVTPSRRPGEHNGTRGNRLYFHAQYALAPFVLRPDDDGAPVIVVNLFDPARLDEVLKQHDLALVAQPAPRVAIAHPR
jgi:hypothetical protein